MKKKKKAKKRREIPSPEEVKTQIGGLDLKGRNDHYPFRPVNKRNRAFGAVAALLVPFAVYVYCLCPTIAGGDTTELITAAATLGIPHAPGYPLFTMLGHVFSWIPFNSVAWRVNLSSAVFSALACLFVYLTVVRLTHRVWAGLAAAWGLGFSRFFWHYAEVAEVFPLNSLFVAVISYILIRIRDSLEKNKGGKKGDKIFVVDRRSRRFFWLLCFVSGLALTNHHTVVLLAPGVVVFLWMSCPQIFREGKTLVSGVALFFLGLLPYVYCPLAALHNPVLNWDNPVNLENFLRLLLRKDFGTFSLSSMQEAGGSMVQISSYFTGLYHQFTPVGLGLAIMGLADFRRFKSFQVYLSISFLLSGLFFVVFADYPIQKPLLLGVLQRFYIMSAVLFSFWIGLGMGRLVVWLERVGVQKAKRVLVSVTVITSLFTWQWITNVHEANFRDNYMAEDFVHNMLLCLPKDALFFVQGDVASMGMSYFQAVLGKRSDVIVLDQEKLTYPWYYEQLQKRFPGVSLRGERYDGVHVLNVHLISDNFHDRPIYFRFFKENSYQKEYMAIPVGLVHRIRPGGKAYALNEPADRLDNLYARFKKRGWEKKFPATGFEYAIKNFYAVPFAEMGYKFELEGNEERANHYYRRALEIDPNHVFSIKRLAVLLLKEQAQHREAIALLERYLKLRPNDRGSEEIERMVKAFKK